MQATQITSAEIIFILIKKMSSIFLRKEAQCSRQDGSTDKMQTDGQLWIDNLLPNNTVQSLCLK